MTPIPRLELTIPIRTHSASNLREHWRARRQRVERERNATRFAWLGLPAGKRTVRTPCVVLLVRQSPRLLDTDNLQGALKACRDQLAACLGVTDGPNDGRVTWLYGQVQGKPHAVRVAIEERQAEAVERLLGIAAEMERRG